MGQAAGYFKGGELRRRYRLVDNNFGSGHRFFSTGLNAA
jgi:hypothetical protein